jgi:hypothetical protein
MTPIRLPRYSVPASPEWPTVLACPACLVHGGYALDETGAWL